MSDSTKRYTLDLDDETGHELFMFIECDAFNAGIELRRLKRLKNQDTEAIRLAEIMKARSYRLLRAIRPQFRAQGIVGSG